MDCHNCRRLRSRIRQLEIERDMHKCAADGWKKSSDYWYNCFAGSLRKNGLTECIGRDTVSGERVKGRNIDEMGR